MNGDRSPGKNFQTYNEISRVTDYCIKCALEGDRCSSWLSKLGHTSHLVTAILQDTCAHQWQQKVTPNMTMCDWEPLWVWRWICAHSAFALRISSPDSGLAVCHPLQAKQPALYFEMRFSLLLSAMLGLVNYCSRLSSSWSIL